MNIKIKNFNNTLNYNNTLKYIKLDAIRIISKIKNKININYKIFY